MKKPWISKSWKNIDVFCIVPLDILTKRNEIWIDVPKKNRHIHPLNSKIEIFLFIKKSMKTGENRVCREYLGKYNSVQILIIFDQKVQKTIQNHWHSILISPCQSLNKSVLVSILTGFTHRGSFPSSLYMMSMYRTAEENGPCILFQHPKIFALVDRSGRPAKIVLYGPLRKINICFQQFEHFLPWTLTRRFSANFSLRFQISQLNILYQLGYILVAANLLQWVRDIRACDATQFCVSEGLLLCRPLEITFTQCDLSRESGSNLLTFELDTEEPNPLAITA